jgi:hypothetical protein
MPIQPASLGFCSANTPLAMQFPEVASVGGHGRGETSGIAPVEWRNGCRLMPYGTSLDLEKISEIRA